MNRQPPPFRPARALLLLTSPTLLLLPLVGCGTLQEIVDATPKPSARVAAARLADLSLEQATLNFDLEISNPYSVALPLVNLKYALASDGREVLAGAAPISGSVPAGGAKTVTVPAQIKFAHLLSVLEGVRPGAVIPYAADLDLSVDAPGVGPLSLPLTKKGKLPVPTVPVVKLENVAWQRLALDEATALLNIQIENANQFPVDLSTFDFGLSLAGTRVIDTTLRQPASFAAGGAHRLEIPITIVPRDLGMAAFRMLTGKGAGYQLGGAMNVDTPYGPISLPVQATGTTLFTH